MKWTRPSDPAWFRPVAISLFTIAAGLRLLDLTCSLSIDEAGSLAQASAGNFWAAAHADVHPPLYFLLLRLGLHMTGSFAALRLFSVACGLALVAMGAFFFRRMPVAAITLGAILAGLPELVRHSQELRPYSLLLLVLGLATMLSIRIATGHAGSAARFWLCLVLLMAAGTYIGSAFFLLSLVPILAWPALKFGARWAVGSLAPLIPAGLLLLWLEYGFVQKPAGLPGGWWMPPASIGQVALSLAEATGWADFGQFADAVSRHLPGGGVLIRASGITMAAFATWAAWGHRRGRPLTWLLLASGLVFMASLVAYSRIFEPFVIARTLLPGLLPIAAGMAWGIGTNPRGFQRVGAAVAISLFFLMASEPGVRRAFIPQAGLRGLAAAARAQYRPGDQLVLFRAMDYGLLPYWPEILGAQPLMIDETQPIKLKLAELESRLGQLPRFGRILVLCRDDYYSRAHRAEDSAVFEELSVHGMPPHECWHEGDLSLFLAESKRR